MIRFMVVAVVMLVVDIHPIPIIPALAVEQAPFQSTRIVSNKSDIAKQENVS